MAFNSDNGGFQFSCTDVKITLSASTWSTRLSQLEKMSGPVWILTRDLINIQYIFGILQKRPTNIFIIAHTSARTNAIELKNKFPGIEIALHESNNAKAVLIGPQTIWISSADFGSTNQIESTVGFHSKEAYDRFFELHVKRLWESSTKIKLERLW